MGEALSAHHIFARRNSESRASSDGVMPSPGEFVPLEPPLTPRTPRIEANQTPQCDSIKTPRRRIALSPHDEHAASKTPGPVREWVFKSDEVSSDSNETSTGVASDKSSHESRSMEESGETWRPDVPPALAETCQQVSLQPNPSSVTASQELDRRTRRSHSIESPYRTEQEPATELSRRSLPSSGRASRPGGDGRPGSGRSGLRAPGERGSRGGKPNVGILMEQFKKSFDATAGHLKILDPVLQGGSIVRSSAEGWKVPEEDESTVTQDGPGGQQVKLPHSNANDPS